MKHLFFAVALALSPAASLAQAPAPAPAAQPTPAVDPVDADPALWVVRDADTTLYLFGTFHLLDDRPWFNDEVKTAFDASQELVTEAVMPEDPASLTPMVMRYAGDPAGRRLSTRLPAAQYAELGRVLTGMNLPAAAFDTFDPWFVGMTLAVMATQRLGTSAANGPETILASAARARNMPMGELEGFEWQFRMFDSMPEALQVSQLAETLEKNDEMTEMLRPMLAAWSTGDVDRLAAIMSEDSDPALHRMLFTDRNAAWARWIQERLTRPGTVFIAVGAGHLAGPDSVQAQLRTLGIASQRVPHVEAN